MKRFLFVFIVLSLVFSVFTQASASSTTFKDVPTSHPFYKEITFLLERGVISPKDRFGVNDKVTREEVAVMVSKAVGLNGTQTSTKFKDVSKSNRSSGYINSAVNAGIINGYTDGTFRPNVIVNRGQMAIFLANAFNLKTESSSNFKDVKPSMASYSAIKKIVHAKITTGYSDNTFRPNETLTRGQISAFLARAMNSGKVDSGTVPVQPPVLGKIALGMTKQQVKNLSGGYLSNETANELIFSNANVLGYLADIVYEFKGNQLVAINVLHHVVYNQSELAVLEAFFVVMYDEISRVYGPADIVDTNWYDDRDGYVLSAFWMTLNHDTLPMVKITKSYDTFGAIRISISGS